MVSVRPSGSQPSGTPPPIHMQGLGQADEAGPSLVQDVLNPREVSERPRQTVDLIDHDPPRFPPSAASTDPAAVMDLRQKGPTFASLGQDVGGAGVELGVQRALAPLRCSCVCRAQRIGPACVFSHTKEPRPVPLQACDQARDLGESDVLLAILDVAVGSHLDLVALTLPFPRQDRIRLEGRRTHLRRGDGRVPSTSWRGLRLSPVSW